VIGAVRASSPRLRAAALWALLFAAYAATLGLEAFPGSEYGGDEPHYLLAAQSIVADGDLDVLDDYRAREYAGFYPLELDMHGAPKDGALREPHGAGFPYLIAPAFAVGDALGVELFLGAVAALAVTFAYLLALRAVPDPWALGAALAVGLSPPFLAYGSAVYPELAAGAALAGAALLALRLERGASPGVAIACFGSLSLLPWLGTKFVPAGLVVAFFALRALRPASHGMLTAAAAAVVALSATVYVVVNEALYGGPTPYAADFAGESATDAESPLDYVGRAYRLGALLVDRDYGLLRWAPVFALAVIGASLLYRRRGGQGARGRPGPRDALVLCAAAVGAQILVAAFLAPTMFGFWFPGRHLVAALPLAVPLVAVGLRRLPRTGMALALAGAATSAWIYAEARAGEASLVSALPDAPWGPLEAVFPFFDGSPLPYALTAAAAAVLAALLLLDSRHWRQIAGATRARYSG
jgi:hypothetical protein